MAGYGPAGYALFVAVYAGLEVRITLCLLGLKYFEKLQQCTCQGYNVV